MWVAVGTIAGFLWRKFDQRAEGMILDIAMGILGACIGGDLFSIWRGPSFAASVADINTRIGGEYSGVLAWHGITGMNLYGVLVAITGSMIFLTFYNGVGRDQQHRRWDDRTFRGKAPKDLGAAGRAKSSPI
jgi:uncharacterized membrane protein YeaQ/YmgE (transglycosylase-associated protein family)